MDPRLVIRRHPWWLLWHPHQGLWNRLLVGTIKSLVPPRPLHEACIAAVIHLDTAIQWLRVLWRRGRRLGPAALTRRLRGATFTYLDCGTHREARQLQAVHRWFSPHNRVQLVGFEASSDHFDRVRQATRGVPCELVHVALVGPDHGGTEVRLYKAGDSGVGDSIFATRGDTYETVPAQRLSAWLANRPELLDHPVILRANIEGSEVGLIEDLIEAGLVSKVDGYFGTWDDVFKIDPARDADFLRTLRAHRIRSFTFNDRDHRWRWRLAAIRYEITTAVLCGVKRHANNLR